VSRIAVGVSFDKKGLLEAVQMILNFVFAKFD
jgi:hypothetical protein